jgi:hypothetical protein
MEMLVGARMRSSAASRKRSATVSAANSGMSASAPISDASSGIGDRRQVASTSARPLGLSGVGGGCRRDPEGEGGDVGASSCGRRARSQKKA